MKKWPYIVLGFLAGCIYIYSCGGGSNGLATTIGNAVDVLFDNSTSGLSATNVQTAIDEVTANQVLVTADQLVGTWTGGVYDNNGRDGSIPYSFVFNADGTYSCSVDDEYLCSAGSTYQIVGNNVILLRTGLYSNYRPAIVVSFDSTKMNFIYYGDNLAVLTKE
jgi:hypothetical protein